MYVTDFTVLSFEFQLFRVRILIFLLKCHVFQSIALINLCTKSCLGCLGFMKFLHIVRMYLNFYYKRNNFLGIK